MENKETLEGISEWYIETSAYMNLTPKDFIKFGAKFQAERMYSEQDMIEFTEWIANSKLHGYSKQLYEAMIIYKVKTSKELLKIWFEQFKKK